MLLDAPVGGNELVGVMIVLLTVMDGVELGTSVGFIDGIRVGVTVDTLLGAAVGSTDGAMLGGDEGLKVGMTVGATEGALLGLIEGKVGTELGAVEGLALGAELGVVEGNKLGMMVGIAEGDTVCTTVGVDVGVAVGGSEFANIPRTELLPIAVLPSPTNIRPLLSPVTPCGDKTAIDVANPELTKLAALFAPVPATVLIRPENALTTLTFELLLSAK